MSEIKLDFEQKNPQKKMNVKRIAWIARFFRLAVRDVKAWRTKNGIHVKIWIKEKLTPIMTVLIQVHMGDDYARSAYNTVRVLNLMANPENYSQTAHELFNVLFYKKLVKGEVASEERYDAKLTKKLRTELIEK